MSPPERRPGPRTCRAETVEVDGVQVVALVRGNDELTDTQRERLAEKIAEGQARTRERTTLVPLPTKFSIRRALRGFSDSERVRRDAATAVHDLLTGEQAWVLVDPQPVLEDGDRVEIVWRDGAGKRHDGQGRVVRADATAGLRVEMLRPDDRGTGG